MKILWLCATALPDANKAFGLPDDCAMTWLIETAYAIKEQCDLYIMFPHIKLVTVKEIKINGISYIGIPFKGKVLSEYDDSLRYIFEEKVLKIQPDIVHICGTEFPFETIMMETLHKLKISHKSVISIQGLTSVYANSFFGFIPYDVLKKPSIGDFLRRESVFSAKEKMYKRGKFEIRTLKLAKNIIGRTDWDKAACYWINPNIRYYSCNESLRKSFYDYTWNKNTCKKHSIFVSQGGYPIKGLDILLKAAGLLIREYPDLEIRIAGYSVLAENNLKNKLKRRNYELYYLQLIKELGLNNKVHFLGALSEMDMVREYCNANVFVLPSIIENSPNSMGEAMLIGTPCVISYCGGIPQLFEHNKDGFLFQPGAYYMLAYYVKLIFDSDDITTKFSKHARMHARTTHNLHFNTNNLLHIYSDLIKI